MKSTFMTSLVVATAFAVTATAQTSTSTQTKGSATQNTTATVGKAGASTASNAGATATHATQTTAQGAAANASASAANQASGTLNLPAGTKIPAMLSKSIDSKKAKAGDKIEATTVADVVSQGKVVIPRNSKLLGHITESQAKARGESESRLGIVFDSVMTKKGQTTPLHANIQAIGAAVVNQSASAGPVGMENTGAAGGGAMGSAGSGSDGGLLGGAAGAAGSAVGGAAGSAGGLAGGVTDTAGNAAGGVGSTLGTATQGSLSAAGNSVALHSALDSSSSGVVGLKGLQLSSATGSSASGSVVTSTGKSVKLDSGSQLMLNVSGGTSPAVQ